MSVQYDKISPLSEYCKDHNRLRQNAETWIECQYPDIFAEIRPLYRMVTEYSGVLPWVIAVIEHFSKFLQTRTKNYDWNYGDVLDYYFHVLRPNTEWCGVLFPHQMKDATGKYHQMMRISIQLNDQIVPGLVYTIEGVSPPSSIECQTLLPIKFLGAGEKKAHYYIWSTQTQAAIHEAQRSAEHRFTVGPICPDLHNFFGFELENWAGLEWDTDRTPVIYSQEAPVIHPCLAVSWYRYHLQKNIYKYRNGENTKKCHVEMLDGLRLGFSPISLTPDENRAAIEQQYVRIRKWCETTYDLLVQQGLDCEALNKKKDERWREIEIEDLEKTTPSNIEVFELLPI